MNKKGLNNFSIDSTRRGIVLLVTLVLLVILSIMGYTLSSRLATQHHRDQYIIDHQAARYACDSGLKYAIMTLSGISPKLINRPDEPDFSDLFRLSEQEYQELLAEWAAKIANDPNKQANALKNKDTNDVNAIRDINDINDINDANYIGKTTDINEPNSLTIRGPYGPPWPFVVKPIEFKIGTAKVRIEIEDENAKYPIGLALLNDENTNREAEASLETFCEWMGMDYQQTDYLKSQLNTIKEIKQFKMEFKPIRTKEPRVRGAASGRTRQAGGKRTTIPSIVHIADFAKLLHSSLIDSEELAMPTIISQSRKESALKYMGLWGTCEVNINTAPRHVLESAFVFGGDYREIAEEIIKQRRVKPFKDVEELSRMLFKYAGSIKKSEPYITTDSSFFTIKVTAISGASKVSAIMAIRKEGGIAEQICVISG